MTLNYPIGIDDFGRIRREGAVYVDKTRLIQGILDLSTVVFLFCRPRRFGKTINLSTLRYFLERTDEKGRDALFEGLEVWNAGEPYRHHFGRYPVITLSFKEIKQGSWEEVEESLYRVVVTAFEAFRDVLSNDRLSPRQESTVRSILEGTASSVQYQFALKDLSEILHTVYGEQVVILIDEYDEPIRRGYQSDFFPQVVAFFRVFLGASLKGNPHLFKAVLTGITRVAKESIFSDLNNLDVYTVLTPRFRDAYGFTDDEVAALLEQAGRPELLPKVRDYYNGYLFGGEDPISVYNPWAVVNLLKDGANTFRNYWINTSSNDLIKQLIERFALEVKDDFQVLLSGGSIEQRLDDNIVFSQLFSDARTLWSLLVASGYLKAQAGPLNERLEIPFYLLSIPNYEVRGVYIDTFEGWFRAMLGGDSSKVQELTRALLEGDAQELEAHLQFLVLNVLSVHDLRQEARASIAVSEATAAAQGRLTRSRRLPPRPRPSPPAPEQIYHVFIAGLLATLEPHYRVRSNRESGSGRPDVMVLPNRPGKPGAVLELKVARKGVKTLEQALKEGIEQLASLDYAAEPRAAGATDVFAFVVAFDGKKVKVRKAGLSQPGLSQPGLSQPGLSAE